MKARKSIASKGLPNTQPKLERNKYRCIFLEETHEKVETLHQIFHSYIFFLRSINLKRKKQALAATLQLRYKVWTLP